MGVSNARLPKITQLRRARPVPIPRSTLIPIPQFARQWRQLTLVIAPEPFSVNRIAATISSASRGTVAVTGGGYRAARA